MRAAIAFFPGDQSEKLAQLISVLKGEEQPPPPEPTDDDEEQQEKLNDYPPPPFVAKIRDLLEAEKFVEVIQTYAEESGLLLNVADRELEAVYNLLIAMVKDVPVETIPSLVKSISDPIVTAAPERAHLRLKILSNLYNSLEHTSPARHDVYLSIVEVASKSDELDTLVPTFAHLDEWVVLWGIPLNKTRDLYRLLSEKLANTKAFKRRGYEFALKLLTTYESSDAKALSSVSEDAIRAVELAVKIPVVLNFEPLHALGSVQALKTAKNGKDVFELLKIFMDGNLKSYKTFVEKKGDFIKKHGFSNEDNIYKMRLLSLASLAANHVQGEVSYDVIATELNIDEDDVEMWVIDGIRAGLIEAKMNQLKRTILVSRATQRIFRKEQWDALGSKLDAWKVHLDDMLQVIANAKLLAIQGIDDIPAQ